MKYRPSPPFMIRDNILIQIHGRRKLYAVLSQIYCRKFEQNG